MKIMSKAHSETTTVKTVQNHLNMSDKSVEKETVSNTGIQDGDPIVYFQESKLFGNRLPNQSEWLKHAELYSAIDNRIDGRHINGLQRVRGMWRIHLDSLEDKVVLLNVGISLRGNKYHVLATNPNRLDGEETTQIKVMDIPLSVEDGVITRELILRGLEIISASREKLRINGKLTNCETGDRSIIEKTSSLKDPLSKFMSFGKYQGRIYHRGQVKRVIKCSKCLEDGHRVATCPNDWKCTSCLKSGHKKAECGGTSDESEATDSDSSDDDDKHETTIEEMLDPTPLSEVNVRKKKSKKSKPGQKIPGQQDIVQFIKNAHMQSVSPNAGKQSTIERSPPTPIERANPHNKKQKNNKPSGSK